MSELLPTSVMLLRVPSELAAAGTVVMTAAMAREFGADRAGQVLAAAAIGVSNILLATGHLLSTTTFLLTCWAAMTLVAVRALRTTDSRWWLVFGVIAGAGLLDSDLVAFLGAAIVTGVLIAGPRRSLMSWWAVAAAVAAGALWAPYLAWQADHGWPQLAVAHAIASGQSGTSAPRWQIVVLQLVLCSPPLVPLWITGLVRLFRDRSVRWSRPLGMAYLLLLAAFLATGGKPYYLAAMFPLLIAAGARPVVAWARRGRQARRMGVLAAAVAVAALADALITLPIVPARQLHATPIVAIDYDVGETVAWPRYVNQIAAVYRLIPPGARARTIVLTRNYGEAGAIDRYGPEAGLPQAYSGHNAFWLWGPPPPRTSTVVAVGLPADLLARMFRSVTPAGRLDNGLGISDDEQHVRLWIASGPAESWSRLWPQLRRYG
jgi:energy-converting hydrogenase Eha subunit E